METAAARGQSGWLWRVIAAGIAGTAEVLSPANDFGAPDWRQAEMVPRMLEYIGEMPAPQRRLLMLLFAFVELAGGLLVPALGRFSRLPLQRRTQAMRRWRQSRLFPVKLLGDGLKMSLTMLYLSHPAVMRHMGEYRACERPADPFVIEVRPGALQGGGS